MVRKRQTSNHDLIVPENARAAPLARARRARVALHLVLVLGLLPCLISLLDNTYLLIFHRILDPTDTLLQKFFTGKLSSYSFSIKGSPSSWLAMGSRRPLERSWSP